MTGKKRLLFITPRVPGPVGGSSQRARNVLEALHSCYEIHLLLVLPPLPASQSVSEEIKAICSRIVDFSSSRRYPFEKIMRRFLLYLSFTTNKVWSASTFCFIPISESKKKLIIKEIIAHDYDVIHLFKLEVGFLLPQLRKQYRSAEIHLDLDDIESVRWERTKEIYRLNGDHARARIASLREEALRASNIIQGILNFARQVKPQYTRFAINSWLTETIALVQQEANKRHIEIKFEKEADIQIEGDRRQLQQALINLLLNAIQASAANDVISVRTFVADEFLNIQVEDQGIGLDTDEYEKVFDPFYTTKEVGEGSGLGLSISLGIIERHNGELVLETNEKGGVTATIILPNIHHQQIRDAS